MSRITISDLAIDSNSFINEVAETEAAFVNGGVSSTELLLFWGGVLNGLFVIGNGVLNIANTIVNFLVKKLDK
ncbi:hypothetical protein [Calothrix sp. 336/3]|uniref:hypothetical protein n=1 Tax=Calothrix sp. 336/3 TaxID=1337936 RepID=UPI0004E38F87|nr:hypothetical protein [Calothrix sp. 336/3]AKG20245.1 hypothetical protein IJ00_02000 [Calothrix sp. 336/3]